MDDATQDTVVRLLDELEDGRQEALDELFPLVYDDLRRRARRHRERWIGDPSLNTTALVHEAYVKLACRDDAAFVSRAHFLGVAAKAMRHILVDHARRRRAQKRGGDAAFVTLDPGRAGAMPLPSEPTAELVLALDGALARLSALDARQARGVECRFFAGMTVEETATALGVSKRTVKRDWALAQAWLRRELTSGEGRPDDDE